jgi:hypothetical protein
MVEILSLVNVWFSLQGYFGISKLRKANRVPTRSTAKEGSHIRPRDGETELPLAMDVCTGPWSWNAINSYPQIQRLGLAYSGEISVFEYPSWVQSTTLLASILGILPCRV